MTAVIKAIEDLLAFLGGHEWRSLGGHDKDLARFQNL
jgi:hypothetical protein